MRKGEKGIFIGIGVFALVAMILKAVFLDDIVGSEDQRIPFYTTASKELSRKASTLIRDLDCRDCHVFWSKRDIMQAVPSPSLDGIGSLKTQDWLFKYLSAEDPQSIVPSRLKKRFRMPSFAKLPLVEREMLAEYLATLKVHDWYLEKAKKAEYEKLTGKTYKP